MYRSKSTYWPFGLACFKLRDSCIAGTIHEVYIFSKICPSIVFMAVLGFFIFYNSGGTKDGMELIIFL